MLCDYELLTKHFSAEVLLHTEYALTGKGGS